MRPGEHGELIFESTTEARVASELFRHNGVSDLLVSAGMEPPLNQPHIGRVDFINRKIEDVLGTSHQQEYTVPTNQAELVRQALLIASIPNLPFTIAPGFLSRDGYMRKCLAEYEAKRAVVNEDNPDPIS